MNLRNRLALAIAKSKSKHKRKQLNFNDTIKESQLAIFLMPRMSMEFYYARGAVESFSRYFNEVVVVVSENADLLFSTRREVITISPSDETWLKLPRHHLVSSLRHRSFDIVFDLSYSEDVFMATLCRKIGAKITVGFEKSYGDHFYDLQVRAGSASDLQKAYDGMVNTVKMFKEK
ncbi:MAG: hypothetical protein ACP5US_03125 [Candidatus Kryptoniota bacterium]